mmetsp:Transcript_61980/g.93591  ORF Transcript_61980/g.93591 Transcript_61980/m.93591 type:complete len:201 (+) Transcript_61980:911-1513(+)
MVPMAVAQVDPEPGCAVVDVQGEGASVVQQQLVVLASHGVGEGRGGFARGGPHPEGNRRGCRRSVRPGGRLHVRPSRVVEMQSHLPRLELGRGSWAAEGDDGGEAGVRRATKVHAEARGGEVECRGGAVEPEAEDETSLGPNQRLVHARPDLRARQDAVEDVHTADSSLLEGLAGGEAAAMGVLLLTDDKGTTRANCKAA